MLRFQDLERATDDAILRVRRRGGGKVAPSGGSAMEGGQDDLQDDQLGMDSAVTTARLVGHVAKTDPGAAAFVTRMLSTQVEPDSLKGSNIDLDPSVLVEQLLVQVLFPLNLPVLWCCCRSPFLRNMSMSVCGVPVISKVVFAFFVVLDILSMALLAVFLLAPQLAPSIFRTEVLAVMVGFFLQKYVVAVKYATLPPAAYKIYRTRDVPARVRNAEQLIAGWLRPSSVVVAREILEASVRLGIDLQSSQFVFRPSAREAVARYFHSVDRLIPARMRVAFDHRCEIPMLYVIYAILAREVVRRKPTKYKLLAVLLGLAGAALFPVMRFIQGVAPFGTGGTDTAACVVSAVAGLLWFIPLYQFLIVAIVDYTMRCKTLGLLGAIVSRKRDRSDGRFFEPIIDLRMCPGNVSAFVLSRRLLLNVGLRYQNRVQNYTNVVVLLALGLGVATLAMTLTGTSASSYGVFELYTLLMLMTTGLMLAVMVLSGASANRRSDEHLALLSARQLETRQHIVAFRTLLMSVVRNAQGYSPTLPSGVAPEEGGRSVAGGMGMSLSRPEPSPGADTQSFSARHTVSAASAAGAGRQSLEAEDPGVVTVRSGKRRARSSVSASTPGHARQSGAEHTELHLTATELLELAHNENIKSPELAKIESNLQWHVQHFEDVDIMFDPAKEAIRADSELHPVRLLGFPATTAMLRSGSVLLLTCVSLALRLVWQS